MDDEMKRVIKTRVQQLEDTHREELQHLIEQQTLALTDLIVQLQEQVRKYHRSTYTHIYRVNIWKQYMTCLQNTRIKSDTLNSYTILRSAECA